MKKRNFLKKVFAVGMAVICLVVPVSVRSAQAKISESDLYSYGINGIYFYDATASKIEIIFLELGRLTRILIMLFHMQRQKMAGGGIMRISERQASIAITEFLQVKLLQIRMCMRKR